MKRSVRELKLSRTLRQIGATSVAFLALLSFSACNDDESIEYSPISASCTAPEDQRGSFMGRIGNYPVRILIDSTFTREQISGIEYAIAQWNAVGQQMLRHDLFQAEVAAVPDSVRKMNPGNCDSNFGDESYFRIVREQNAKHWESLGFSSRIPGATFRCEQNARVVRQMVYIYDELVPAQQFASVIVHEIGHAVGLDHSCLDGEGRPDFRSCGGLESNHPYRVAVMYPWLKTSSASGSPEVKDVLRVNDKQRGQCMM